MRGTMRLRDQLAINTIRTLAIDAVQKAKSGHRRRADGRWRRSPTRCGAGSCATTRRDPTGPNRDRFVLSAGHASMLLYALLHLAGVERLDEDGRPTDEPAVSLDDIEQFRQLGSVTPGHPEYALHHRRRDHHRAARPGRAATSVGMAMARALAGGALQQAGHAAVRLQRLCHLQRRRHDGGRRQRGGLAGRPPEALATSAGSTTTTTSPSRARPSWPSPRTSRKRFEALWLGDGCTCDDANDCEAFARRHRGFQATERPADADPGAQRHRLRLAAQAGHLARRTAIRSARTR